MHFKSLCNKAPRSWNDLSPSQAEEIDSHLGLNLWLTIAASTNGQSGDLIDISLRHVTQAVMEDHGIGNLYDDAKYNQYSNDMARSLLSEIAETGDVSLDKFIKKDSQNFTNFSENTGRITTGDWPGSLIDNSLFGGNSVDANSPTWIDDFLLNLIKNSGEFSQELYNNSIDFTSDGMENLDYLISNSTGGYAQAEQNLKDTYENLTDILQDKYEEAQDLLEKAYNQAEQSVINVSDAISQVIDKIKDTTTNDISDAVNDLLNDLKNTVDQFRDQKLN